jgi:hypothetical protein
MRKTVPVRDIRGRGVDLGLTAHILAWLDADDLFGFVSSITC